MLRPSQVIEYAKERAGRGLTDFHQLVDGVNVGDVIIVGGNNAGTFQATMNNMKRLGTVQALNNTDKLFPAKVYVFDVMAIAGLIMVTKNEAFHDTITSVLNMLQEACVRDGHPIEVGLQLLREQADTIDHM